MTDGPTTPAEANTESADTAPESHPESARNAPETTETTGPSADPESRRYGRGQHPNSRRNLTPWRSDTAPRTAGKSRHAARRPMSILGHLRLLAGQDLPTDELERQARRKTSTHNRRVAARLLLDTLDDEADTRRKAMAELLDRIEGRPVQVAHVLTADVSDPATLLERARAEARAAVVGADMPATQRALPPPAPPTTGDPPDDGDPHTPRS